MQLSFTLIIIIITGLVSFSAFSSPKMVEQLIFYPPLVKRGQVYRFFSCGLIHADAGHLIFNMLALYIFGHGSRIETYDGVYQTGVEYQFTYIFGQYGKYIYFGMYILALFASLLPTYIKNINNYHYRSLGASGGVSAVVFASIMLSPMAGMGLFFIPIYFAGFLFGILYLLISNMLERRGGDNINHSAHIFGALFGVGFTIIACQFFSFYPVLDAFVEQIKNANPRDFIRFGR